jgi:2-haloacid dehalogenase
MLVSSNGFDIRGATLCGLKTARIERVSATALQDHLVPGKTFGPAVLFRALRTQLEGFGSEPDVTVASLLDLQDAIAPV